MSRRARKSGSALKAKARVEPRAAAKRGATRGRAMGIRETDRSPDIRKSISEATGGTLDMSGRIPPAGNSRAQGDASRQQPIRGDQDNRGNRGGRRPETPRGDTRGGEGRRGGDRGKQQPQQRAQSPRSAQGQRQPSPRPSPSRAAPANPYDIPMEERMKQYREKYGRGLGTEKRGPSSRRSQQKPGPQEDAASRIPPKPQGGAPESKPEGLFGHLFGAFKKKNP
jgi:hypothetical protein